MLIFLLIILEIILAILCYYSLPLSISPSHNVKTVNFTISSIPLSSFLLSYKFTYTFAKIFNIHCYCFKQYRHVYTNTYEYTQIGVCVYT